jgi:hypothetical protein
LQAVELQNQPSDQILNRSRPHHGSKSNIRLKRACGEIVLDTPLRRSIFLEDLIGTFALDIILMLFR